MELDTLKKVNRPLVGFFRYAPPVPNRKKERNFDMLAMDLEPIFVYSLIPHYEYKTGITYIKSNVKKMGC